MSLRKRIARVLTPALTLFSVVALLVPAGASARQHARTHSGWRPKAGYTALTLDANTATVLTSDPSAGGLGLSVAPIAPATASGLTFRFPIDGTVVSTMHTGLIRHSGGIAIAGGGTTVNLQNFVIDPAQATLSANVSVVANGTTTSLGRVVIVSLDLSAAQSSEGGLVLGPVGATLNTAALGDLGAVFGVPALGTTITSLPLGSATVNFRAAR